MTLKTRWLLLLLWMSLPFLALAMAGGIWLWEHHYTIHFAVGAAVVTLISWPVIRKLQKQSLQPLRHLNVEKDPHWAPRAELAWKDVEALTERVRQQDIQIDKPEELWKLLKEVLETVARRYHPDSDNAVMETPVPQVLRVVELVAFDLRQAFSTHVPGSHIITINDAMRFQRLAQWFPTMNRMYRVASLAVNPVAALARELAGYIQGKVINASAQETKQWAVEFALQRAGFYAIQLYSGQLDLDHASVQLPTSGTQQILEDASQRDTRLTVEPLRVLIMGQVKAGKSSLVNALFGQTRSAVDVVPRTVGIEPFLLERDGLKQALIFDSAGYEDIGSAGKALTAAREQVLLCDVVLLVCSALTAARDPDRRMLDDLRKLFLADPDRTFPAFLVVLTHIDQLRPFREWTPPYNIAKPQTTKEQNIREAIDAVAGDLQVPIEQVIPVCLAPGQNYNVNEALMPAILESLPTAQRSRYLRCLKEHRDDAYWDQLWQQTTNAGRVAGKVGLHLLYNAGKKLDAWSKKFTKD